jgi:hypothetical protein
MLSPFNLSRAHRLQPQLAFLGWVPTMFVSVPIFGPPLCETQSRVEVRA